MYGLLEYCMNIGIFYTNLTQCRATVDVITKNHKIPFKEMQNFLKDPKFYRKGRKTLILPRAMKNLVPPID